MTIIVVTHEMGFASKVTDRVVFMDEGRVVEDTPKDEFFGAPRSERAKLFLSKILRHEPARRSPRRSTARRLVGVSRGIVYSAPAR